MRWLFVLFLSATSLSAGTLPGIRVETLASTAGFASSVAVDSRGILYYTTTRGDIFRLDGTRVASVTTDAVANSGLLGMALVDDRTAAIHYTTPLQTHDVVSTIDLESGVETVLARLACDATFPGRPTPPEHHGGNPAVAGDGSIFVGIGDFGGFSIAQSPDWIAGKIYRVWPDGRVQQFARGFRNPFDLSWDAARGRLIVPDNGEDFDDEINVVVENGNYGWPTSMGHRPPLDGDVAPLYVFPERVAPTGITSVNGRHPYLRGGYLIGSFVAKAIDYVPDIDARPLPDPIRLMQDVAGFVIDVAQGPGGEIYFTTGTAIHRLQFPAPGDCDGNGRLDLRDHEALDRELLDGSSQRTIDAQTGVHPGAWGCDANTDGAIDGRDRAALMRIVPMRIRAARGPN